MTDLLKQLIAIPRPSRGEDAGADFLEGYLRGLGLDVKRVKNNLWVESEPESDKPTILLNAHLDTVKPASGYTRDPYDATEENGAIYGLGSNDCGGALVSLLQVYMQLVQKPQPYRLIYSVTAEEEVGGKEGLEAIIPLLGKVDLGVIGEPTGMQMAVAERGLMVLDCVAHGKSGHAAREEGVNAIYKALEDIDWFRNYRFPEMSDFIGPVKMTVTMINAGTQHNVVPDMCKFVVDVRSNGIYDNLQILEVIKRNVKCEFAPRSTRLNGAHISLEHPIVKKGLGMGLKAYGSPTTSNQSVCPFTTIKIGPGDSSRSHTADEFILVSEIEQGVEIYTALLEGLQL